MDRYVIFFEHARYGARGLIDRSRCIGSDIQRVCRVASGKDDAVSVRDIPPNGFQRDVARPLIQSAGLQGFPFDDLQIEKLSENDQKNKGYKRQYRK